MEGIEFKKIFLWELISISLIFILGILTAWKFSNKTIIQQVEIPNISLIHFLLYFFIGTTLILLLGSVSKIKRAKGRILKFIFLVSSFYGSLIVFSSFLSDSFSISLSLILIFSWFKFYNVFLNNLLNILALAGIGAVLGLSFDSRILLLILGILSVYDFIAVYKTKHMIKMAKTMIEEGVVMGLAIPKELKGFSDKMNGIKMGERHLILGGGDIVGPLILSVSVINQGIVHSVLVGVFSLFGIVFTLFIFSLQKKRKAMPALPPIVFFSIIGYLINLLI